jgi:hypothetical protein
MATNTAGSVAREIHGLQAVHTFRKTVNFNDTGIGTADTVPIGVIPAGAFIIDVKVKIVTAFNAGTTNVLTAGSNAGSDNNIVAAGDVDETATGTTSVSTGWGLAFAADTTIYARYTQTGGAATTGQATFVISYVPNNDG